MKIAITGASGHLGANLLRTKPICDMHTRVLVHKNPHDMTLHEHDIHALSGLDVEQFSGDINDVESLKQCFDGIDLVYHLAAEISLDNKSNPSIHETNVIGTRNVVTACLDRKVKRLVYTSSIHAFNSEPADQAIVETRDLLGPNDGDPYSRSKANGLREIEMGQANGLDVVSVFPTGIIGPYDFRGSYLGRFFLDLYRGEVPFFVEGGFNFVDARDVATGLVSASKKGRKGGRYLMGGHYVSIRELINIVHEVTGKKMPTVVLPIQALKMVSPVLSLYAKLLHDTHLYNVVSPVALESLESYLKVNHNKSARELGFKPRSIHETVCAIYLWHAEYGLLKPVSESE